MYIGVGAALLIIVIVLLLIYLLYQLSRDRTDYYGKPEHPQLNK